MSDLAQFPPPEGTLCRLVENRFGIAGQSLDSFRRREVTTPDQLTRITLPKGSLFVIVKNDKSSYTPQTNWGRQLMGEKVEDVMTEVLCDSHRCIILLSPEIYELVEVEK